MAIRTPPRASLIALALATLALALTPATAWGTSTPPTFDPAHAVTEWVILTSGPPYEVLILDGAPIGPINRQVCGMYSPAPPVLTLYTDTMPRPPGTCYPMLKAIRRLAPGRWTTALQQNPGNPYTLGLPGDVLPIQITRTGPIIVTLPPQVKERTP